jgi:hypothetical protein
MSGLTQEGSVMTRATRPRLKRVFQKVVRSLNSFSCVTSHTINMSDNGENEQIYNNSHRAFLQSFLSRATLTFEQARPIVAAIEKAQGSQPSAQTPDIDTN